MSAPVTARVHPIAAATIATASAAAAPAETGGILLGWWDGGLVVIRHAMEVPDADATTTGWTRNEQRAQIVLAAALAEHAHPWLGYVGDWHTHPAPCGPSRQDERSIRRASRGYAMPLLLLVYRSDQRLEARAARGGRTHSVILEETTTRLSPA